MFLHWGTRPFSIFVEEQHSLWQLAIVKSLCLEHISSHCLVVTLRQQSLDAFALILLTRSIQSIVECEFLYFCKVFLLKISGWHIIIGIHEAEDVLEHTARCTGGRYEFHYLLARSLIVFPCLHVSSHLTLCRSHDAFADRCRSLYFKERKTCLKLLNLLLYLSLGNTFRLQLLNILLLHIMVCKF